MIFKHPLTQPQASAEMQVLQLVKKDFDKLVDGGASSPARCRVSNLRFEPSAVSPSAKPENPLGFQPSCHPYQFLLKSFRFPGAKTARKRFLLWKMGFSAAKILPCPPYMPLGTIEIREGFGPLELSKGFSTVCYRIMRYTIKVLPLNWEKDFEIRNDIAYSKRFRSLP